MWVYNSTIFSPLFPFPGSTTIGRWKIGLGYAITCIVVAVGAALITHCTAVGAALTKKEAREDDEELQLRRGLEDQLAAVADPTWGRGLKTPPYKF